MPSSNKTAFLALNKWLGSDKPKKDDFNSDNMLIDTSCRNLSGRVDALEDEAAASAAALQAHVADGSLHVTPEEKAAWNEGGGNDMVFGTYVGNGALVRVIQLDTPVRFGMLYAVGKGSAEADWTTSETKIYYAFFGTEGCSRNVTLTDTALQLQHTLTRPADGSSYKYNESDVTYVYVIWPK